MRILYVTTVSSTMNAFFKAHIKMLVDNRHRVDLACNDIARPIDEFYKTLGCQYYHIDFSRSPLSTGNIKAFAQLKKVVKEGHYDIVHCHTPNAAVITRLVCRSFRKNGLKVFYTAHGFHFFKGAPKLNWLVFYPIEKFCSRFTDKLITINKEDYNLAKTKFHAKEVHYVPGVGIDLSRFENVEVDRAVKRREIGVPEDAFLLLSVGELNENKNHQVIIKAMAKLNNAKVHYAIAGVGDKRDYLFDLAKQLGVAEQLHLLGFRKDVPELNHSADVFCFPSLREGLGLSAIEAMACGLPIITSNVHGINDYSIDEVTGFKCPSLDEEQFAKCIDYLMNNRTLKEAIGQTNVSFVQKYNVHNIVSIMKEIYQA